MTFIEAANKILHEAGKPLHYREITKIALDKGYITTKGKTPEATMNANFILHIMKKGSGSQFRALGKGIYALTEFEKVQDSVKPVRKRYSFADAAEKILDEHSNKQPIHYTKIIEIAITHGYINTEGQTPGASLIAIMGIENKKRLARAEKPRFKAYGNGLYGLTKWEGKDLIFKIEQPNTLVKKKLLESLKIVDPGEFEELVAEVLIAVGFREVNVTNRYKDGGIDIRGVLVIGDVIRTKMAVQVKRWKNNVQSPTVQQIRGSLGAHEQGLIITTSDFSKGAIEEAERTDAAPIGLMDGTQLVNLMVEHGIKVEKERFEIIDLV